MARDSRVLEIVIGADLSCPTAASELCRRGIDVIILEVSHNVGGRANSTTTKLGSYMDFGGQWIGYGYNCITDIIL